MTPAPPAQSPSASATDLRAILRAALLERYNRLRHFNTVVLLLGAALLLPLVFNGQGAKNPLEFLARLGAWSVAALALIAFNYSRNPSARSASRFVGMVVCGAPMLIFMCGLPLMLFDTGFRGLSVGDCLLMPLSILVPAWLFRAVWQAHGLDYEIQSMLHADETTPPPPDGLEEFDVEHWDEAAKNQTPEKNSF